MHRGVARLLGRLDQEVKDATRALADELQYEDEYDDSFDDLANGGEARQGGVQGGEGGV